MRPFHVIPYKLYLTSRNVTTLLMMSDSSKRALTTDVANQSELFNRTGTSPDLAAQLRSVGARVRKSVTEGYITPPTSRAFTKAQSTTTIFSSAKDINREVFNLSSDTFPTRHDPANVHKKRSRSTDRGRDIELDNDHSMAVTEDASANNTSSQPTQIRTDRAIKPLRNHWRLEATRSLPVEAFRFSHQLTNPSPTMAPPAEAEEDWSTQPTTNPDRSTFEPVTFD